MHWYIVFIFYLTGTSNLAMPNFTQYKKEFNNRWDCTTYLKENQPTLLKGLLGMYPNVDKRRSNILCINERKLKELEESSDKVKYRKFIKYAPVAEWFSKVFVSPRRGFDSLRGLQAPIISLRG